MFISQGPRGSLQAGGKICWVSSVTFIGWELHYISFFFHPFPRSSSLPLAETFFWQSMCVHACVCVWVCARSCEHVACAYTVFSTPWSRFRHQHILHLSLSLPRHLNFLHTSFTAVPWRTDTSSSPSSSLFLSLCHSFPAPITLHLSGCLLSAVSTLSITVPTLFRLNKSGMRRSFFKTVNSFGIESRPFMSN